MDHVVCLSLILNTNPRETPDEERTFYVYAFVIPPHPHSLWYFEALSLWLIVVVVNDKYCWVQRTKWTTCGILYMSWTVFGWLIPANNSGGILLIYVVQQITRKNPAKMFVAIKCGQKRWAGVGVFDSRPCSCCVNLMDDGVVDSSRSYIIWYKPLISLTTQINVPFLWRPKHHPPTHAYK